MTKEFYKVKDIQDMCMVKSRATIINKLKNLIEKGILKSHCLNSTSIMLSCQDLLIFLDNYYKSVYDVVKDKLQVASQIEGSRQRMTSLSNGKVYQPKGKSYWYIRGFIRACTEDGIEIPYKNDKKFKTKKEAQKFRDKLIRDRSKGVFLKLVSENARDVRNTPKEQPKTFIEYAENYIKFLDIAQHTFNDYESIIRIHLKPFFKDMLIKDITGQCIREFAKSREGQSNITKTRALLNQILDSLLKDELITYNGYKAIKYPKDKAKGTQAREALTRAEVQSLLDYYKGKRLEYAIHLLLNTGMRLGELQALTWNDIEIKEDNSINVSITSSWGETEVGLSVKEVKNKYSNRVVYIPPNKYLVDLLETAYSDSKGCKYVLYNSKRTAPIEKGNFSKRYLKEVAKELGIEKNVTAHVLRHTYVSLCLSQGISKEDITKQVGHADTTMISRVYGHAINSKEEAFKHFTITDTTAPKTAKDTLKGTFTTTVSTRKFQCVS